MAGQVWDADPVAASHTWLRNDPTVLAEFGHEDHVTGIRESPWPHLIVGPGEGGDLGTMQWESRPGSSSGSTRPGRRSASPSRTGSSVAPCPSR